MKICPNCGTAYDDAPVFCSHCGTQLPEASAKPVKVLEELPSDSLPADAAVPVKKQKGNKKKLLILALAGLVIICFLGLLLVNLFSGGKNIDQKDRILLQKSFNDEVVAYSRSGKIIRQPMESDLVQYDSSGDGSRMVFLNTQKELWLYANHGFTKLADSVNYFKISFDGSCIVYQDTKQDLYRLNSGETVKIAEKVINIFCLSPDGKAVAYRREEGGEGQICYYDGKERQLPKGSVPLAISAGARYVYYNSDKGVFFVQRQDKADTRQKLTEDLQGLVFNADATQVMVAESEATYFSENGKERRRLSLDSLSILFPAGAAYSDFILGRESLKGCCFRTRTESNSAVYFLDHSGALIPVLKGLSKVPLLTHDGKDLYYEKGGVLYRQRISAADAMEVILMEGVKDYLFSQDFKSVLYVNKDNETCFLKIGGKESRVTDEAVDIKRTVACRSGFVYESGGLLYFTNGGKASRVSGISDDVERLYGNSHWVVAECSTGEVFVSTDGRRFTKLLGK